MEQSHKSVQTEATPDPASQNVSLDTQSELILLIYKVFCQEMAEPTVAMLT